MKSERVIFDFGTTYFTIFYGGKMVLREPTAIVLKKSLQTTAVHIGEEALALKGRTAQDEFFRCPVKKGAVSHHNECVLLIKSYMKKVFGMHRPPLCVLISCGLKQDQRREIEQVFVEAGYTDIFLMEALWGLVPTLNENHMNVGVIIGGENTEVGVFVDNRFISGYSLDLGSATINSMCEGYFREHYNIVLTDKELENMKLKAAPLFKADNTKVTLAGKDSITGRQKILTISSRDIYEASALVYGSVMKTIDAVLCSLPEDLVEKIAGTGILFAGYGSLQTGLRDYAAEKLGGINIKIAEKGEFLPFAGAEKLCRDSAFIENYLGLKK